MKSDEKPPKEGFGDEELYAASVERLAKLSAEEIAKLAELRGCAGSEEPSENPAARLIQQMLDFTELGKNATVSVTPLWTAVSTGPEFYGGICIIYENPPTVKKFMEDFLDGKYPNLLRKEMGDEGSSD
jgi:hypothetical protein